MFKIRFLKKTTSIIFSVYIVFVSCFVQSSDTGQSSLTEIIEINLNNGKKLQVNNIDGFGYLNDMILGRTIDLKQYNLKIANANDLHDEPEFYVTSRGIVRVPRIGYTWLEGIIPYTINKNLGLRAKKNIEYSIKQWNSKTKINLIPRTFESDYLEFVSGNKCSSWIGRQGGRQTITLSKNCDRSQTMHQIGHSAGLFHEHSRSDRDKYLNVIWNNIIEANKHYFQKLYSITGKTTRIYNYYSVMHTRPFAFSINGSITLEIKDPAIIHFQVGGNGTLSDGDIGAINTLYNT